MDLDNLDLYVTKHFISSEFLDHMNSSLIMLVSGFANNSKNMLYIVTRY